MTQQGHGDRQPGRPIVTAVLTVSTFLLCGVAVSAQTAGPNDPATVVSDSSISGSVWNTPGNARVSDNIYATSPLQLAANTQYLKATGFSFAIPAGAVIDGIQMHLVGRWAFVPGEEHAVAAV